MREVLLFPFQGMRRDLQTLFDSLRYILKVRIRLFGVVVWHILKNGDEYTLAKVTWELRTTHFRDGIDGMCATCTESTTALQNRLHKGAIHEITDRTRLRRAQATMPLRNPDYLEQLRADGPVERNYDRQPRAGEDASET
jgi:hypothetical protein